MTYGVVSSGHIHVSKIALTRMSIISEVLTIAKEYAGGGKEQKGWITS